MKSVLTVVFFLFLISSPLRAGKIHVSSGDAELVLGQPDFVSTGTSTAAQYVADPQGVCVDPATGKVFVADHFNHRVLRYASADSLSNGDPAEIVLGQAAFLMKTPGTSATAMRTPSDVAIDAEGNLWVADSGNHRVLRFPGAATILSGAAADLVFGQADFAANSSGTGADQLNLPVALDLDAAGNLYIADSDNARVLIHLAANGKSSGTDADIMLGQAAYGAPSFMTSQQILHYPGGLAVDGDGTLFVTSYPANRILVWENAASLADGALADRVIGQPNFTAMASGLSQSEFGYPQHLAIDEEGTLYVADQGNHRILVFRNASELSGEVPADAVLGQEDFVSNTPALTASGMNLPGGVGIDNEGRIMVGDGGNGRILFFPVQRTLPDLSIIPDSGDRIGEDVLDATGASQKLTVKTTSRRTYYHLGLANDGNGGESFLLKGSTNAPKFKLSYHTGSGENITAAMLTGLRESGDLAVGQEVDYEIRLKSKKKDKKARATVFFTAESKIDGEIDRIVTKTKYTPAR